MRICAAAPGSRWGLQLGARERDPLVKELGLEEAQQQVRPARGGRPAQRARAAGEASLGGADPGRGPVGGTQPVCQSSRRQREARRLGPCLKDGICQGRRAAIDRRTPYERGILGQGHTSRSGQPIVRARGLPGSAGGHTACAGSQGPCGRVGAAGPRELGQAARAAAAAAGQVLRAVPNLQQGWVSGARLRLPAEWGGRGSRQVIPAAWPLHRAQQGPPVR